MVPFEFTLVNLWSKIVTEKPKGKGTPWHRARIRWKNKNYKRRKKGLAPSPKHGWLDTV